MYDDGEEDSVRLRFLFELHDSRCGGGTGSGAGADTGVTELLDLFSMNFVYK